MQRCPCCNARLKDTVNCPRCKAELEHVIRVQELARLWHQKAIACYLNHEVQHCLDALTQSLELHRSESALLFRAFVIKQQEQTTGLVKLQRIAQDILYRLVNLFKCLKENLTGRFNTIYLVYKSHFPKNL